MTARALGDPPCRRLRHSHGAAATRAPGSADHDDLHTRIEPWRLSCAESGRHALGKGRRRTAGLAGRPAGSILGGVALLDMTSGDLRLSQSQQLAVQGLELGCPGAAAGD